MKRAQALLLQPGDSVRVIPLYNMSERLPNKVPVPAPVLSIRDVQGGCESGVLVKLATNSGRTVELDAGWLEA